MAPSNPARTPWRHIIGYSFGQGATSLTLNSIYTYGMLYYTQARGLSYAKAGAAFAVASFWDAMMDPAVGHLSDNTRGRWGRRHPYILLGGLLMALSFYLIWAVPPFIFAHNLYFIYVVLIYMMYRSAFGIFSVPYIALGFEVCTDYHQRSQLQGASAVTNTVTALLGPALGWYLFFSNKSPTGAEPTSIPSNFIHMGGIFALATVALTILVIVATRGYMRRPAAGTPPRGKWSVFFRSVGEIFGDRCMRLLLLFFCTALTGMIFVGTLQQYLFVYFMHLSAVGKAFATGGATVMGGLGAVAGAPLSRKLDKKYTVVLGASLAVAANLLAAVLFCSGILKPDTALVLGGAVIPVAVIAFIACVMFNTFGVGIYSATVISMLADAAEANELSSGVRKDGGFSAVYSFTYKLVVSAGVYIAGLCLAWVGFAKGSDHQSPEAVHSLVLLAFGLGALFPLVALPIILRYPITREIMARIKAELELRKPAPT